MAEEEGGSEGGRKEGRGVTPAQQAVREVIRCLRVKQLPSSPYDVTDYPEQLRGVVN